MAENEKSIGDMTLMALLKSAGHREVSEDAAATFYARYMEKLMSLVERNLASKFSARVDPEDIVQSIFATWFRRTKEGRINPGSQDEVWKLISVIALNKVRNKVKHLSAKYQDVGRTESNETLIKLVPDPGDREVREFLELIEAASQRLDDKARRTLELILEDRSVEEIAKDLSRTTKSVGRYKKEIGKVLKGLLDEDLKGLGSESDDDEEDDLDRCRRMGSSA